MSKNVQGGKTGLIGELIRGKQVALQIGIGT